MSSSDEFTIDIASIEEKDSVSFTYFYRHTLITNRLLFLRFMSSILIPSFTIPQQEFFARCLYLSTKLKEKFLSLESQAERDEQIDKLPVQLFNNSLEVFPGVTEGSSQYQKILQSIKNLILLGLN